MRPPSALGIFAFLIGRTTTNMALRRLKRLREPRYLVGLVIGAAYFYFTVFRPMLRNNRADDLPQGLPAEVASIVLLMGSLALAIVGVIAWLFFKGTPRLELREPDVQFLLPAPLSPRAVVHFSMLRSQLGLIFSSLVVGFFLGRGISPHGWQRVLASWIVMSTLGLHAMGIAFSKARWNEMAPERARMMRFGSPAVAILLGVTVLGFVVDGVRLVMALVTEGDMSRYGSVVDAIRNALASTALASWRDGFVPGILLAPVKALLAPVFTADPTAFLLSIPAALLVLLLHYAWVVRVSERYQEAAIAGAQRSAERAVRRSKGLVTGPAPRSRREVVPFRLGARGIPELAIVWKNLLCRSRFRLRSTALGLVFTWLTVFLLCLFGAGSPGGSSLSLVVALILSILAPIITLTLPIGLRIDFRADLEWASVLRSWPLSATRLVVAELVAPLVVAVIWIWGLLGGLLAVLAGQKFALLRQEGAGLSLTSPLRHGAGEALISYGIPAALGLALFLPGLAMVALIIQNAAVLAWPDWFPPGQKRARGFEATGGRLLSMFGTLLLGVIALIPAALVGALVAWIGWRFLGAWALVPAALAASIPVWAEAAAATLLLGRLFESFDVASEALE